MSTCRWCPRPRPESAWRHGWVRDCCVACYHRWSRRGFPPEGPPAPGTVRRLWSARAGRLEDYAELRSWGAQDKEAAERLGVSLRTVWRYKRELREMAGAS